MSSTRFFAMLPAALLFLGGPQAVSETPEKIDVVASRFSYSPSEITLKKGQPVILVFHTRDVTHGVKLPELNIDCAIQKGKDTEVTVTPSQTGQFFGKCAYFCGKGHGSMTLQINVVE
jgi:cytochrome c oxidase subunit II